MTSRWAAAARGSIAEGRGLVMGGAAPPTPPTAFPVYGPPPPPRRDDHHTYVQDPPDRLGLDDGQGPRGGDHPPESAPGVVGDGPPPLAPEVLGLLPAGARAPRPRG